MLTALLLEEIQISFSSKLCSQSVFGDPFPPLSVGVTTVSTVVITAVLPVTLVQDLSVGSIL